MGRRGGLLSPRPPTAERRSQGALRPGHGVCRAGKSRRGDRLLPPRAALRPDLVDAHFDLAKLLQELGKSDEAVAYYRRATELDPNNRAAQIALVHQLQHLCQWDELAQLSRRVIEVVDQDMPGVMSAPMSPFSFLTLPMATTGRQQLQVCPAVGRAGTWFFRGICTAAWRQAGHRRTSPRSRSAISRPIFSPMRPPC